MKQCLLLLLFSLSYCSTETIDIPEIPYPGELKIPINEDLFCIGYINITSVSPSDNIFFKVKYHHSLGLKNTKYAFVSDILNINITDILFMDLPITESGTTLKNNEKIFEVIKEKDANNFLIIKIFFENPGTITIEANDKYLSFDLWNIIIGSIVCLFLLSCFIVMCIIRNRKLKSKNAKSSEKIDYSITETSIATNTDYDQYSNS